MLFEENIQFEHSKEFFDQLVLDEAELKFGKVISYENKTLLIQRKLFNAVDYMTIKVGFVEPNICFNDGHYNMDLGEAVVSFYERSKLESKEQGLMELVKALDNWNNNLVQFPRLLSEIVENIELSDSDIQMLCLSMDLSKVDINNIFDRALIEWQAIKEKI